MRVPSLARWFVCLALCFASGRADAYCFLSRSAGPIDLSACVSDPAAGINWQWSCAEIGINPNGVPRNLSVDALRTAVNNAATTWNRVHCPTGAPSFQFVMYPDVDAPFGFQSGDRNANLIGFRDPWPNDRFHIPLLPLEQLVWFNPSAGHIIDMDMDLNPQFALDFSTRGEADARDLESIALRFMGFGAGLGPSQVPGSVMDARWNGLGPRRALTADDIEGFCRLYPPGRSAVCDPEPYNGFAGDGCGCHAGRTHSPFAAPFWVLLALLRRRRPRSPLGSPG